MTRYGILAWFVINSVYAGNHELSPGVLKMLQPHGTYIADGSTRDYCPPVLPLAHQGNRIFWALVQYGCWQKQWAACNQKDAQYMHDTIRARAKKNHRTISWYYADPHTVVLNGQGQIELVEFAPGPSACEKALPDTSSVTTQEISAGHGHELPEYCLYHPGVDQPDLVRDAYERMLQGDEN